MSESIPSYTETPAEASKETEEVVSIAEQGKIWDETLGEY